MTNLFREIIQERNGKIYLNLKGIGFIMHATVKSARAVAAMLREQNDNGNDDISILTPSIQNLRAINQQTGLGNNRNQ